MASNTPLQNGFTINRMSSPEGTRPIPFELSCREEVPGVYGFGLSPLRIIDMCDLLARYQALAVYGVDSNFLYDSATGVPLTLQRTGPKPKE